MDTHYFSFSSSWLHEKNGVRPLFKIVDQLFGASHLSEKDLCSAIFRADHEYDKMHNNDKHRSTLEALFDALTICEYVMTTRFTNQTPNQVKMILVCMELYLKASVMKLDKWVDPNLISDSEIEILENEVPKILSHLKEIEL